jgi:hypothetical protein
MKSGPIWTVGSADVRAIQCNGKKVQSECTVWDACVGRGIREERRDLGIWAGKCVLVFGAAGGDGGKPSCPEKVRMQAPSIHSSPTSVCAML